MNWLKSQCYSDYRCQELVKKVDCNTKINKIEKKIVDLDHDRYITNQEFNNLTAEHFAARLKETNLASKNDIDDFLKKKADFDNKLNNSTKNYFK